MALSWPPPPRQRAHLQRLRVVFSELRTRARRSTWAISNGKASRKIRTPTCRCWGSRAGWVWAGAAEHRDAALELLAWLSSNSSGDPASAASPATTLYRRSQLEEAINWVEKPVSPAAASQ